MTRSSVSVRADGVIQVAQRLVAPRGLEPEAQPGDLHRLRVQVRPEQVLLEEPAVQVEDAELLGCAGQLGDGAVDPLVFLPQRVEGGHQKNPRPAGRVQNLDVPQPFQVIEPDLEALFPGQRARFAGAMAGLNGVPEAKQK
jgi:hypothetical protein